MLSQKRFWARIFESIKTTFPTFHRNLKRIKTPYFSIPLLGKKILITTSKLSSCNYDTVYQQRGKRNDKRNVTLTPRSVSIRINEITRKDILQSDSPSRSI